MVLLLVQILLLWLLLSSVNGARVKIIVGHGLARLSASATEATHCSYESLASHSKVVEGSGVLRLTTKVVTQWVLVTGLTTHGTLLVS